MKRSSFAIVVAVCALAMGVVMAAENRGKRSDDIGPLEAVVDNLAQQISALSAQLTQINGQVTTQLDSLSADVVALKSKTDKLGRAVAFYAVPTGVINATPEGTLVIDHATTNAGNAYSTRTGVFTAPVPGLYYFQTTFMYDGSGTDQYAYASIAVDGRDIAKGISDMRHDFYDQTTVSAVVHLNAGQEVFVKNDDSHSEVYHGNNPEDPYTTFSGFLVFAD